MRAHRRGETPPTFQPAADGELSSAEKKRRAQVDARRCKAQRVRPQVQDGGTRFISAEAGVREVRAGAAPHGEYVIELEAAKGAGHGGRGWGER